MNLNHVTVPVSDLSKSIKFYETLGLKLIVESQPHYAPLLCPDGNSTFSLNLVEHLPSGDGIHVSFECENLDDYVNELIGKNIEFEEMPTDKTWLWSEARLKDPDNNLLILYYAGENRLNPPWRIN